MFSNLLTDLFKKIEGQGILSTEQASNMNKPVAGPVNVCDPNDPNYLECVQRNYQGGEGQRPSIDYESFAAKPSSGFEFNLGDMFSSLSQPQTQERNIFNPLGFSNQTRLAGLALGPTGILASLAVEKYKAGQEAKAAAEAKAAEEARARQEQINRNKQYFSGSSQTGGGGGGFDTSAADRAGTSLGSGQFSPSTSRGRSGY